MTLVDDAQFHQLRSVLDDAYADAVSGKGTRHHRRSDDVLVIAFEDQLIVYLNEQLGSTHFAVGQAVKKAIESVGKDHEPAERELLGAIIYLAAAVVVHRRARSCLVEVDRKTESTRADDQRDDTLGWAFNQEYW